MFRLKGCPHCGGDLSSGLDDEHTCIQCGYVAAGSGRPWAAAPRPRPATCALVPIPVLAQQLQATPVKFIPKV